MHPTVQLTEALIKKRSITPEDDGCQDLIASYLFSANFKIEHFPFADVKNLYATHGNEKPSIIFLGHTDVVPTGPLDQWTSDPFTPSYRNGFLYGRGAADMKGSVAAFTIALTRFVNDYPTHPGSVGLLITSDEEGVSINGVRKVMEEFNQQQRQIDYCIVGEPSCETHLGDTIKVGRRGSLNGKLTIFGKQGHIAYPHKSINPIHCASHFLHQVLQEKWDEGFEEFQPTQFQISNINAGTGATNIIPGEISILFNFRYNPIHTPESLEQKIIELLDKCDMEYKIDFTHSGGPFYSNDGKLKSNVCDVIKNITGVTPNMTTHGGTSDGRFVAPTGTQVIEFGPINESIHRIDEHVSVKDLELVTDIYYNFLKHLLDLN